MGLTETQWALGALAAFIIGLSKTGVPGVGILMVPLMAAVFGGRLSVGATLPMLIFADCFAVYFYRAHADVATLKKLAPWVVTGLLTGTAFLKIIGDQPKHKDPLNPVLGAIVLLMVLVTLLRKRLGDRLIPTSPAGTALTGVVAGFSTMVSNAAGPVMQIYVIAAGMSKEILMGTVAVYFFIFNLAKLPLQLWLTWDNPKQPLITVPTLEFNAVMLPVVFIGVMAGKKLLPAIPQRAFGDVILVLTAAAAIKLMFFS